MNSRWAARGAVVALHLALLAALWLQRPATPPRTPAAPLSTVWLLPAPAARAQRPAPAPPAPAPRPERPPRPQARADTAPAATAPAAETPVAEAAANAVPPAAAATEPPRSALRLTLPPGYASSTAAARNPALSDPRSNTGRPTLEDRIAAVTGGAGAWVEENVPDNRAEAVGAQGDHRSVFRRGDTCVEVFRSRITDVDPFNGNVAPRTVKMVGKPYKCK